MRVEDFNGKILVIELPWEMADVRLDPKGSVVHVTLVYEEWIRWKHPCCDRALAMGGNETGDLSWLPLESPP